MRGWGGGTMSGDSASGATPVGDFSLSFGRGGKGLGGRNKGVLLRGHVSGGSGWGEWHGSGGHKSVPAAVKQGIVRGTPVHDARPWAGPGRRGEWAWGERKEMAQPQMNSTSLD
jgi:hypothetical protein